MRTCTICGQTKNEQSFFYRNKKLAKLHSQCKDCYIDKRRRIWREHYHKYGSKYRERAVARNHRLKIKRRRLMLEYLKDKSCAICQINDPRVLEFDHLDPSAKSFSIARGNSDLLLSWPKILAEIEKCQILCANCHKIKTAQEQNWYKNTFA